MFSFFPYMNVEEGKKRNKITRQWVALCSTHSKNSCHLFILNMFLVRVFFSSLYHMWTLTHSVEQSKHASGCLYTGTQTHTVCHVRCFVELRIVHYSVVAFNFLVTEFIDRVCHNSISSDDCNANDKMNNYVVFVDSVCVGEGKNGKKKIFFFE